MAWFGPAEDRTYYVKTNQEQKVSNEPALPVVQGESITLFDSGQQKMEADRRSEALRKQKRFVVKYFAPQLIDGNSKGPKLIRSGSKLIGFLMNAIDTRHPSFVRVRLPKGGEAGGIEIEPGSVLTGQYSYGGQGDRVYLTFSRLDSPEGISKKIQAQALDSGSYTVGISGDSHSDMAAKVAAQLGLTMFSGMADVMTEKESLGFSANGVQAKSTMQNALLQGLSRAAQDQIGRTSAEINSAKDYLIVPAGKEMIIELTEDYQ
jgi:hypothetical protein